MECQQCLPPIQLKGKHCQKPYCRDAVVDTFGSAQVVSKERPQTETPKRGRVYKDRETFKKMLLKELSLKKIF